MLFGVVGVFISTAIITAGKVLIIYLLINMLYIFHFSVNSLYIGFLIYIAYMHIVSFNGK